MRILFGILLFALYDAASAQEISVKSGFAIPSGSYSNVNIQKSSDRFASTGGFVALEVNYPVIQKIGISAQVGYTQQGFNSDAYNTGLMSQSNAISTSIKMQSDYQSSYALIGAYIHFPKGKFDFVIDAGLGWLNMQTPAYTVAYEYTNNTGYDYVSAHTAQAMLFNWGIKTAYQLPKHFSVSLSVENLVSNLSIPVTHYTSSDQQTSTLKFDVYQVGLGVGYSF